MTLLGRYCSRWWARTEKRLDSTGYDPHIPSLLTSVTNAYGDVVAYTHDTNTIKVTSITFPGGLVRTNIYYTNGPYQGFLQFQIDVGIRTNSFGYLYGNMTAQTNELGLVTTYSYDALNRVVCTTFPDGTTISNVYNNLDLVGVKDRLNHWTLYQYNLIRQLVAMTNVNGQITQYGYCGCGQPNEIVRYNGVTPLITYYTYDLAGHLTNATYPDGYELNYTYDSYRDTLTLITDGSNNIVNIGIYSFGLRQMPLYVDFDGEVMMQKTLDQYGRVTNSLDRNNVNTAVSYDYLDRMTGRQRWQTGIAEGAESFGYNTLGLTNYYDQLGHHTTYVRDIAGRILYQTNANDQVTAFTYNPSGEILTLTDGNGNLTTWNYDQYGRPTNKVDAASEVLFTYQYDVLNRLTNRWSIAKSNTVYAYDNIGNLTNVSYLLTNVIGASTNISYAYDGLNRLTNMIDALGTTSFTWTPGNQLASEQGPWESDTVSYSYNQRFLTSLNLTQPSASPWSVAYTYNTRQQLNTVTSPAGTFTYEFYGVVYDWPYFILLPTNGMTIYYYLDGLARLTNTTLYAGSGNVINTHGYGFDNASRRNEQSFTYGNYINYSNDNIGQLIQAKGWESDGTTPRLQEQFGYGYDAGGNLNVRTNNALIQSFGVNNLNELTNIVRSGSFTVAGTATEQKGGYTSWGNPPGVTNVTVSGTGLSLSTAQLYDDGTWAQTNATLANGNNTYTAIGQDTYGRQDTNAVTVNLPTTNTFVYDLNGNLCTNNTRIFDYDSENQLIRIAEPGLWKSEFVYDGKNRRRIRREYTWQSSGWQQTNEVHYIYVGNLVIQERNIYNLPLVTYTRGNDLSGSQTGAGGIGGLLARTDNTLLNMPLSAATAHAFYHCDGSGNITAMINALGISMARYEYDPYGNIVAMSGPLADANVYRFSSKEFHDASQLYHYGYRYYFPNSQRWLNRDPLSEASDVNLYRFVANRPVNLTDPYGLQCDMGNQELWDAVGGNYDGEAENRVFNAWVNQMLNSVWPSSFPHSGGVGGGGNVTVAPSLVGVHGEASAGGGVFSGSGVGGYYSYGMSGGFAGIASPQNPGTTDVNNMNFNPAIGTYAGLSWFPWLSNARTPWDLAQTTRTYSFNIGLAADGVGVFLSTGNGIWQLGIAPPLQVPGTSWGIDFSDQRTTTIGYDLNPSNGACNSQ